MNCMINQLTISELTRKLAEGEVSSRAAVQACLDQIQRVDGQIRAFLSYDAADAMAQADGADQAIAAGQTHAQRPLLGVPVAIKDLIAVKGHPLNCGSKILGQFVSPYDAAVIERLRAAGAVIFGRLNMDEFAMGSSTENSAFGATRNPWDTSRIPGGSSGGSAAAVAADECLATLGSDTGGSIRQPAALCGVVGLKPTYGRVSRYGLVAFASSLDQIGSLTKDVRDAATMLGVLAGHDPQDSTSADVVVPDYSKSLKTSMRGMKVGVPKEFFTDGMDPEVEQAVRAAIEQMKDLKAEIKEISLPMTKYAVAVYYVIATAEASSNLARYDGVRYGVRAAKEKGLLEMYTKTRQEGFGAEVKRRIMLGTYALSAGYYEAYYGKAQVVRTLIKRDFDEAFKEVDIIVTPTMPTPAFQLGEKVQDPLQMYLSDIFTISVNLAGVPAIAVPCGLSAARLPIGVQIIGRAFEEEKVLRAAYAYEQATEWHKKRPGLSW